MLPDIHEERALNHHHHHQHTPSDTASLRSFASSSITLPVSSVPGSPIEEKHNIDARNEQEVTSQIEAPLHWRKTPLTRRGLFSLFIRIAKALFLPSFLQQHYPPKPRRKLHPTSYLDGLRGVAAFIVFIDHFIVHWYENIKNGYLATPKDAYLIQLPFLRLLYSGRASVGVFFVISGFVLSYKPLLHIRSSQPISILQILSSSVLRRSLRLYLPILAGTCISAILAYRGAYLDVPSRAEPIPPKLPTIVLQYQDWLKSVYVLLYPFNIVNPNSPYSPPYNGHLWTIPIEFYGSMVVFTVLLMLSLVKNSIRMLVVSWLALWSLRKQRWDVFLFLSGTLLAELHFINSLAPTLPFSEPVSEPSSILSHPYARPVRISIKLAQYIFHQFRTSIVAIILFTSLYLLSYPGDGPSPGLYHAALVPWTPEAYTTIWYGHERFYLSLGSPLLLLALLLSPRLQAPFNYAFPQYLGDISYSLYIVHGMVLFTLGTNLMQRWTGAVGTLTINEAGARVVVAAVAPSAQYTKAFLVCVVSNTVTVVWCADVFWRVVDSRCVRIARGIEGMVKR